MERSFQRSAIVGASSGIGEALARQLVDEGGRVAIIGRRRERLEAIAEELNAESEGEIRVFPYVHDVRNTAEIPELFQRIATELGGLELVVYSSGVMPTPAFDEYPTEDDICL